MIIHSWNHSVWNSDMLFFYSIFVQIEMQVKKRGWNAIYVWKKPSKLKHSSIISMKRSAMKRIPQQLFTHLTFYGRFYAHQMWHIFILKDSLDKFPQQPRGHHYFLTPFAILSLISETIFIRSVWHFLLIEVSAL